MVEQLPGMRIKNTFMKKENSIYDPKNYWENRGKKYRACEYVEELEYVVKLIRRYKEEGGSFLEVGSGYGRVYLYLKEHRINVKNFTMCDISESIIEQCFKRTSIRPDLWDGKKLSYKDNFFDFVILFSVLLHVPKMDIPRFMKECARVTKTYLIVATSFPVNPETLQGHCFDHDYYSLFLKNLIMITDVKYWEVHKRTIWVLKKY